MRVRECGIDFGVMRPGKLNAITDVEGVRVGHVTISEGESVRTGVTAIIPHAGNIFQEKVPAGIHVGNGHGKLTGITQLQELGNLETPIVLTNTLSVCVGIDALIDYTLAQPGNEAVKSVNAVVGETSDGMLSDIRGRHVRREHVLAAIAGAKTGEVEEGCVGAGTGTICFGFKGGIGTSSRVLAREQGGYAVGVLVQSNFGGILQIAGAPVGRELGKFIFRDELMRDADGSCMMIVATDAPLCSRNLTRLAQRAFMGLARTGGIASNGSGDYAIAFSTARRLRIPHAPHERMCEASVMHNDHVSPLFLAAIESTEEAIINSLFAAKMTRGSNGLVVEALPVEKVMAMLRKGSGN